MHLVQTFRKETADATLLADILERSGLPGWDCAAESGPVPYDSEVQFVRQACHALDDVTFGARAGISYLNANHVNGYIGKYSRNLREAVENTSKFQRLLGPAMTYSLSGPGNAARLEIAWKDRSYAKFHRHVEFMVFVGIARMRTLTKTQLFPLEVRFDHDVGLVKSSFEKIAGCPVIFGAEAIEITLPVSALDLPIPTYDPSLRAHLMEYGARLLREQKNNAPTLRSKIEGKLMERLPGKILSADEMATSLGLSTRSFARRLASEGLRYRDVVDQLRCDLAETFLRDKMSLSEIAHALGYADQSAFSTAFKRWTGAPPRRFRR